MFVNLFTSAAIALASPATEGNPCDYFLSRAPNLESVSQAVRKVIESLPASLHQAGDPGMLEKFHAASRRATERRELTEKGAANVVREVLELEGVKSRVIGLTKGYEKRHFVEIFPSPMVRNPKLAWLPAWAQSLHRIGGRVALAPMLDQGPIGGLCEPDWDILLLPPKAVVWPISEAYAHETVHLFLHLSRDRKARGEEPLEGFDRGHMRVRLPRDIRIEDSNESNRIVRLFNSFPASMEFQHIDRPPSPSSLERQLERMGQSSTSAEETMAYWVGAEVDRLEAAHRPPFDFQRRENLHNALHSILVGRMLGDAIAQALRRAQRGERGIILAPENASPEIIQQSLDEMRTDQLGMDETLREVEALIQDTPGIHIPL